MISRTDEFLMQAYLNREMDADTETAFELELLRRPDLAQLAESDTALAIGLRTDASEIGSPHVARSAIGQTISQANKSPASKPNLLGDSIRWASAASILALLAGWAGYTWQRPANVYGGAKLAYVDKQRSLSATPEIQLPTSGPLVLMVPVASSTACTAQIVIRQAANEISAKAAPDEFGYAVLVLSNNALIRGNAAITVRCDQQVVGEYQVSVR
jgi:hypothetical protein